LEIGLPNVQIFPDVEFLARGAADHFIQLASQSIQENGVFSVALSGGSTPQTLYQVLASEPFSEQVDWSKVHLFWGDERCVPPEHPDSNYHRAEKTFISNVPIPEANVHRILAELPPKEAAEAYEETLINFFNTLPDEESRHRASFDLVLLGMGEDGHTASLFPGTEPIHEANRWVSPLYVDPVGAWRITLTPVLINRAGKVIFLVAGSGKNWILQKVLYGSYQPERYPAQIIRPFSGDPLWLVDEAAASFF
jgi:6-phosphogluconolactonase